MEAEEEATGCRNACRQNAGGAAPRLAACGAHAAAAPRVRCSSLVCSPGRAAVCLRPVGRRACSRVLVRVLVLADGLLPLGRAGPMPCHAVPCHARGSSVFPPDRSLTPTAARAIAVFPRPPAGPVRRTAARVRAGACTWLLFVLPALRPRAATRLRVRDARWGRRCASRPSLAVAARMRGPPPACPLRVLPSVRATSGSCPTAPGARAPLPGPCLPFVCLPAADLPSPPPLPRRVGPRTLRHATRSCATSALPPRFHRCTCCSTAFAATASAVCFSKHSHTTMQLALSGHGAWQPPDAALSHCRPAIAEVSDGDWIAGGLARCPAGRRWSRSWVVGDG